MDYICHSKCDSVLFILHWLLPHNVNCLLNNNNNKLLLWNSLASEFRTTYTKKYRWFSMNVDDRKCFPCSLLQYMKSPETLCDEYLMTDVMNIKSLMWWIFRSSMSRWRRMVSWQLTSCRQYFLISMNWSWLTSILWKNSRTLSELRNRNQMRSVSWV